MNHRVARTGTPALLATALATLALLAGCAALRPNPDVMTPDQARALLRERLPEGAAEAEAIPFDIGSEVRALARSAIRGATGEFARAEALAAAILARDGLAIEYAPNASSEAASALATRTANCLAYTNLFVGMAREVDLNAVYVEVGEVEEVRTEGDLLVRFGHVCAGIFADNAFVLIDFAGRPAKHYVYYRVISDLEAIASSWNNRGYELAWYRHTGAVDPGTEEDIEAFRRAITIYPGYARAHNNLGVALAKRGRTVEAEEAYRTALRFDPDLAEPHSNLADLRLREGRLEEAGLALRRAARKHSTNPYYMYRYGVVRMLQRDYDGALDAFRKALRRRQGDYPDALAGIGQAELKLGRPARARKAFEELARREPGHPAALQGLAQLEHLAAPVRPAAGEPEAPEPVELTRIEDGT